MPVKKPVKMLRKKTNPTPKKAASTRDSSLDELKQNPEPQPQKRHGFPLERGWRRRQLIHELARAEKTTVQLAKEYGVGQPAISMFKKRHLAEIEEVKQDIDNEFAGLWIVQKKHRIAEYQQLFLDITEYIENAEDKDPAMIRLKIKALKEAAEEMGHLPARTSVQVNTAPVTYSIEGVNLEDLK